MDFLGGELTSLSLQTRCKLMKLEGRPESGERKATSQGSEGGVRLGKMPGWLGHCQVEKMVKQFVGI